MANSVSNSAILALKTTFDPTGVVQAKAAMQELQRGQASPGWGSLGPSPAPAAAPAATAGGRGSPLAGALGRLTAALPGGGALANVLSEAGAGPVAAALAVFAVSQVAARSAQELRANNREAGITTEYYGRLAVSARQTGISIGETVSGIKKARSEFQAATIGGDVGESMFLRSLGLSDDAIAHGRDNAEEMVRSLAGRRLTAGQKTAMFGSVAAADAAMAAPQQGSFLSPSSGQTLAAAKLGIGAADIQTIVAATWSQIVRNPLSPLRQMELDQAEADRQQRNEIQGQAEAARIRAGVALAGSVVNPAERYAGAIGRANAAALPGDEGRYRRLLYAQAGAERLAAEAPFLTPRQQAEIEGGVVSQRAAGGGYSTREQAGRAQLAVGQRLQGALESVQSRFENLAANLAIGQEQIRLASSNPGMTVAQSAARGLEQRDVYRRMGLQIQDYADTMTHAGGLAGAADMTSVAGYSQLVSAQESMRQTTDSRALAEMLLQRLPQAIAQAIRDNFGFQFRRPMGPLN